MKTLETLPTFNIDLNTVIPKLNDIISRYKSTVEKISNQNEPPTWDAFHIITVLDDEYHRFCNPLSHLNNVKDNNELRLVYDEALSIMSSFSSWVGQHKRYSEKIKQLKDSGTLDDIQQKVMNEAYLSFELSGVDLSENEQKRFVEISQRLSELSNTFSKNSLDATKAWTYHTLDKKELDGIPETVLSIYENAAKSKGMEGYLITLDYPARSPLMSYCHNRDLREKVYKAHITKASTFSEYPEYDNTAIINEIMQLRFEKSSLLKRGRPADISLMWKMAETPEQIIDFLYDLSDKAQNKAKKDEVSLCKYAKDKGCISFEVWDRAYYQETMKKELYNINDEEIKQYFQLDNVLEGLFKLVETLYGIEIRKEINDDVWIDDVKFFRLYKDDNHFASLYMDLYSAPDRKREGAWMDEPIIRWNNKKTIQLPVAHIICNFASPTNNTPSLLSHYDVLTIFHEFGHALHSMLTKVDIFDVSGTNGIEWDAVELPSQIMENWTWCKEVIDNISEHYETKEKISDEMFNNMIASKNFMSAHSLLYYISLSLFDMLLHMNYNPEEENGIREILLKIRSKISVVNTPYYDRFENNFGHIFSGGYAAGYYSYLWSQILSDDCFSKFEEEGIFNSEIAERFLKEIISRGGTKSMKELFFNFMGRDPTSEAMLKNKGIIE